MHGVSESDVRMFLPISVGQATTVARMGTSTLCNWMRPGYMSDVRRLRAELS